MDERRLFLAAQRVRPDRRDAFLARVCQENAHLRARVRDLLRRLEHSGGGPASASNGVLASFGRSEAPTAPPGYRRLPPVFPDGHVIAGRYRVVHVLGRGGQGIVYRARDEVLGTDVAVKVSGAASPDRPDLEALTLRRLRVPGVVSLHEDGAHDGHRYLVMDLVGGTPFPGSAGTRRWAELRSVCIGLLETLARIHAQGVVHGDLKPGNVLVDAAGVPVVLDVGTAGGPDAPAFRRTPRRFVEGTLAYMAPERLAGSAVSVAADLYAVGVMACEALTGAVPHAPVWDPDFVARRSTKPPAPVLDVPDDAARLLAALLRHDPAERPGTAYEALGLCDAARGGAPFRGEAPWLGSRATITAIVEVAREGRSVEVAGAPGAGKSRNLLEATRVLEAEGRTVRRTCSSAEPLGSLRSVLPGASATPAWSASEEESAEALLTALLAGGTVVVVDPWEEVDARSQAVLRACRPAGSLLVTTSSPAEGALRIPALEAHDLEALFAGPRRLFHLPEDAAEELHRRAGGNPRAALAEAGAWVRTGLATWDGSRLAVSRASLARFGSEPLPAPTPVGEGLSLLAEEAPSEVGEFLRLLGGHAPIDVLRGVSRMAGPDLAGALAFLERAGVVRVDAAGVVHLAPDGPCLRPRRPVDTTALHARIAAGLPDEDPRRLRHLRAAGQVREFADTLLRLTGTGAIDLGRSEHFADLCLVAQWRRGQPGGPPDDVVAANLLWAALLGGTRSTLEVAQHELAMSPRESDEVRGALAVARLALKALAGDPQAALTTLTTLPESWSPRLCACADAVRIFAARSCAVDVEERVLAEAAGRRERSGRDSALEDWIGWLRYRQGRFADAAALHLRQAERWPPGRVSRIASRLSAASALMEEGDLVRARAIVDDAWPELVATRNANFEARAEWIRRSCSYRLGEPLVVDWELVEALLVLEQPHVASLSLLTEAAIAWRAQQYDRIAGLLREAGLRARAIDRLPLRVLIDAFALHLAASAPVEDVRALVHSARGLPLGLRAQVVALLADRDGVPTADADDVRRQCESLPTDLRRRRREVFTYDEVLARLSPFSRKR